MLGEVTQREQTMTVRVLIVDDQPSFRRAARNVVELTQGFEAAGEVATGEASVEAALLVRPDLVLMDVRLPGIDGLEASRRIRVAGGDGNGPVIVLVSAEEPDDQTQWRSECGAAAYVSKAEFGLERLLAAWLSATAAS
jgi:DNA-binding NarL/FixJ family response regulator